MSSLGSVNLPCNHCLFLCLRLAFEIPDFLQGPAFWCWKELETFRARGRLNTSLPQWGWDWTRPNSLSISVWWMRGMSTAPSHQQAEHIRIWPGLSRRLNEDNGPYSKELEFINIWSVLCCQTQLLLLRIMLLFALSHRLFHPILQWAGAEDKFCFVSTQRLHTQRHSRYHSHAHHSILDFAFLHCKYAYCKQTHFILAFSKRLSLYFPLEIQPSPVMHFLTSPAWQRILKCTPDL